MTWPRPSHADLPELSVRRGVATIAAFAASAFLSLVGLACAVFGPLGYGVPLLIVLAGVSATGTTVALRNRHAAAFAATARSMTVAWTIPWLFVLLALTYGAFFTL